MQSITDGTVFHRTVLMEQAPAVRFARCLGANDRFRVVSVEESGQAKHPTRRWFVRYQPAREERVALMVAGQQAAREARAAVEAAEYLMIPDPEAQQPLVWCISLHGEYETTLFACTCGDYLHRLRGTGIRCKHMVAVHRAIESGAVVFPQQEEAQARSARDARYRINMARVNMARDFPED